MKAVFVALLAGCSCASAAEQVHIALGLTESALTVSWASSFEEKKSEVKYGLSPDNLSMSAAADTRAFTVDFGRRWHTHVANMTGLKTNTTYYYKVGEGDSFSDVFSVVNRRQRATNEPYRHIIMGDMGSSCAFSLCSACTQHSHVCDANTCKKNTTVGLISEVDKADMFLHVGDFAYNMASENGVIGDHFFKNIEQVAANMVYMVSHGNHEDSDADLAHYTERFRNMPSNAEPLYLTTKNGRALNSLYFSWDYGRVHYVSMSTELWWGVSDPDTNVTSFIAWLKADLAKANLNREQVPWVVVEGHRSIYCTSADCTGQAERIRVVMEPILFEYGVDFFVNGHEHNYERTWPLYQNKSVRSYDNPRAPIYVVSGAAGSKELHDAFTKTQPEWSAFRSNSFSYSRLFVHNATHLNWQQVQTDPTFFPASDYGRVIDDWWVVQDKHGPFNAAEAPTEDATGPCLDDLCDSHDHWEPMLGLERQNGEKFVATIARFRKEHGEEAWMAKLRSLMSTLRKLGDVEWEDVHENGNSDNAWRHDGQFKWKGDSA